jgi:hypothetical protein
VTVRSLAGTVETDVSLLSVADGADAAEFRAALLRKARGKVLQTDEPEPKKPGNVSNGEWARFTSRATFESLHFDLQTLDD